MKNVSRHKAAVLLSLLGAVLLVSCSQLINDKIHEFTDEEPETPYTGNTMYLYINDTYYAMDLATDSDNVNVFSTSVALSSSDSYSSSVNVSFHFSSDENDSIVWGGGSVSYSGSVVKTYSVTRGDSWGWLYLESGSGTYTFTFTPGTSTMSIAVEPYTGSNMYLCLGSSYSSEAYHKMSRGELSDGSAYFSYTTYLAKTSATAYGAHTFCFYTSLPGANGNPGIVWGASDVIEEDPGTEGTTIAVTRGKSSSISLYLASGNIFTFIFDPSASTVTVKQDSYTGDTMSLYLDGSDKGTMQAGTDSSGHACFSMDVELSASYEYYTLYFSSGTYVWYPSSVVWTGASSSFEVTQGNSASTSDNLYNHFGAGRYTITFTPDTATGTISPAQ